MRSEKREFLMIGEFANLIGVHPNTVRTWDRKGQLKPHHVSPSGQRYYSMEQVEEIMNGEYAGCYGKNTGEK